VAAFGDLKVRIDPWEIDYGTELPLAADDIETGEQVDCTVEVAAEAWAPITPERDGSRDLVFVDGIRRLELRLLLSDGGALRHGAFGSFATGAARTRPGDAAMVREEVLRLAVASGGLSLPRPLSVAPALVYRPCSTQKAEPDAPLRALHEAMRSQEEKLAQELSKGETLVVVDGPLTFAEPERGGAVGFVKRLFKLYLEPQQLRVVEQLAVGQRSPLFALCNTRRFDRYSWYLRLAQRPVGCAELAGVVRLEVASAVGKEAAQRLADLTARLLPAFAPSRPRDPRAPQNLLPIGAIEATLRRRLGDARLIRRHLEAFIIREDARG
jgi:hypothetical protein